MATNISYFCETTSLHGVPEIYRAQSRTSRVLWIILFACMLFLTGVFIYLVLQSYFEAPIVTTIYTVHSQSMLLPEIAVCYSASINANKLLLEGMSLDAVKHLVFLFQLEKFGFSHPLSGDAGLAYLSPESFAKSKPEIAAFMQANNVTTTEEFLAYISYDFSDIVYRIKNPLSSSMPTGPEYCDENCYKVVHPIFGVCTVLPRREQTWPGAVAGWALILKVPPSNDLERQMLYTKGFAVEFGIPDYTVNYNFVRIPTNMSVSVLLTLKEHHKIQYRQWPRVDTKLCEDAPEYRSITTCSNRCFAKDYIRACNCGPLGLNDLVDRNAQPCLPDLDMLCTVNMTQYRACQMACIPACKEVSIGISMSYSDLGAAHIIEELNLTDNAVGVTDLRIAYAELSYSRIEEQDPFGLDMTICNVGGMIGLWLGASIFTVIHVLAFCLEWTYKNFRNGFKRKIMPAVTQTVMKVCDKGYKIKTIPKEMH